MNVRQLKWVSETKSKTVIELHCEEELIDEGYWIQNYYTNHKKILKDGIVYLCFSARRSRPKTEYSSYYTKRIKCKSIEEAKQKAQLMFEAKIVKIFGAPPVVRKVLSEKHKIKKKVRKLYKPRIEQLELELQLEEFELPEDLF